MKSLVADVAIVGGGLGGCAAALAAARAGQRVILTEETRWLGGQLTSEAVPPDEHPWIEQFGANAAYRELRQGIRDYYRAHLPLTRAARSLSVFNPGNGFVSQLCHDPRVSVAVLNQMLAPYELGGRLFVLRRCRPVKAFTDGDRIEAATVVSLESGDGVPFTALPYASKVTGFLQDLGKEVPPLENIGIGQLIARIDRSWDTRREISSRIAARLPALQERARETNRLVVELLQTRGATPIPTPIRRTA